MKKHNLLITMLLPFVLVACGGDGGITPVTYTGSTTQAEITTDNAEEVVVDSVSSTSTTSAANGATSAVNGKAINKALNFVKSKASQYSETMRYAPVTVSDTVAGTCGGSMSFTTTIDDQTFDMSSAITANNYCEDEMTMSGTMNMTFSFSQENAGLKVIFNNLKVTSAIESFTISGTMESTGLFSRTMTMNMVVVDNKSSEQIKLENFIVTTGTTDVEFSGKIYTATSGYVDVTTLTPMDFGTDGHMTAGSIKFTGASSSVTLSAQVGGGYKMETDIDGDATIDDTQTGAWADLSSEPLFGTF